MKNASDWPDKLPPVQPGSAMRTIELEEIVNQLQSIAATTRIGRSLRDTIIASFPRGLVPDEDSDLAEVDKLRLVHQAARAIANTLFASQHGTGATYTNSAVVNYFRLIATPGQLSDHLEAVLCGNLASAMGCLSPDLPENAVVLARRVALYTLTLLEPASATDSGPASAMA